MICEVLVRDKVEIIPDDLVVININKGSAYRRTLRVKKIIERSSGINVVFNNGTWRPMSTHGLTWLKLD